MQTLFADLRFAFRMLAKHPGFTTVAVLALALGIGANTAVFSVVRGVLLRPLPYGDPGRLVALWESNPKANGAREPSSPPNFRDWSARNQCFTSMAAHIPNTIPLTESGEAEMLNGGYVTGNYFETLGVKAALGRTIEPSDAENDVVALSYELWDRRFGRDPGVVGRHLRLGGALRTVIGVMPPGFRDADFLHRPNAELWISLERSDIFVREAAARRSDFLRVIARMNPASPLDRPRPRWRESRRGFASNTRTTIQRGLWKYIR